jgi:hypothetical protein
MNKLRFTELTKLIDQHNKENNITTQFQDENPLMCVAVVDNVSFETEYPLESRSYIFRSDNKYFLGNMGGNSIFAKSLDDSDTCRLDWYFGEWVFEYFYIMEEHNGTNDN